MCENEFSKVLSSKTGMSMLSRNIRSINAKFEEFCSFADRVNTHNPISTILLQVCCIDDSAIDLFLRPCSCYQLHSIEQNMYVLL